MKTNIWDSMDEEGGTVQYKLLLRVNICMKMRGKARGRITMNILDNWNTIHLPTLVWNSNGLLQPFATWTYHAGIPAPVQKIILACLVDLISTLMKLWSIEFSPLGVQCLILKPEFSMPKSNCQTSMTLVTHTIQSTKVVGEIVHMMCAYNK